MQSHPYGYLWRIVRKGCMVAGFLGEFALWGYG